MDSADTAAATVQSVFEAIHETRMKDLPIVNRAISVETIGFASFKGDWLGVLVTPWCINLMLLPGNEDTDRAWRALDLGASMAVVLPAGRIGFILGEETGIGRFKMCSLFSPVLEFQDQEAAVAAGSAALAAVLDGQQGDQRAHPDAHMFGIATGAVEWPVAPPTGPDPEHPAAIKGDGRMSRRQLITGRTDAEREAL